MAETRVSFPHLLRGILIGLVLVLLAILIFVGVSST